MIRQKAALDIQPADPELDTQPIREYEVLQNYDFASKSEWST